MRKSLLVLTVCILSVFMLCHTASAQRGSRPALTFYLTLPENETAGGETKLDVFINERLVDSHTWKAVDGCVSEEVIASLPHELSQLKNINLLSLVSEKALAFDSLPWNKMIESFDSFDVYANGKRVHHESFSQKSEEEAPSPVLNPGEPTPQPTPDCTPNVGTPSISCTPWVAGAPVSNSYSNPCILGMNCDKPIWGSQTCTVTTTTSTRSCTTSTTTTWTPHTPGVTCPGPTTVTSTSVQSSTFTSAPTCGPCS